MKEINHLISLFSSASLWLTIFTLSPVFAIEPFCPGGSNPDPNVIFCDDFENNNPLIASGRYFDYNQGDSTFVRESGTGYNGSNSMHSHFNVGTVNAGGLYLAFGSNPGSGMTNGIYTSNNFREMYARWYVKLASNWSGHPYKMGRMAVFTDSSWSQAAVAHVWPDGAASLAIEPVSCTTGNTVNCVGYNDFTHFNWLGETWGTFPMFDGSHNNTWDCVEMHWKLNTSGNSDGTEELWLNGVLQASHTGLNFVGTYSTYGINGLFLENYWNGGATQADDIYLDNIVVSTHRIGCLMQPNPPTNLMVQ